MTDLDVRIHLDRVVLRVSGEMPLGHAADQLTEAILVAREHGLSRLLVDARDLLPTGKPAIASGYFRMLELARASDGHVRVALIAEPGRLDPRGFGALAAANSGLAIKLFATEAEAMGWLSE